MKRSLSIFVFALLAINNLLAEAIETPVSYAYLPGRESTLKYKFSYEDENFYTNLRFIKGSQNVFKAGDQIVMTPSEGNPTTFIVTEELLKDDTSEYLLFETPAEGMDNMIKGIKSISLVRDGNTYDLVQNNYFNSRARKDASKLARNAYKLESLIQQKKLLEEEKELATKLSEGKKEIATIKGEYSKISNIEKRYNRVFIGYAPTDFHNLASGDRSLIRGEIRAHGFNVGWLGGFNITRLALPLYLETGVTMNAGFPNFETIDYGGSGLGHRWFKTLSFEVPVNITYRYNIPHTKIRISPYFGFHFKVNTLFTYAEKYEITRYDESSGKTIVVDSYREHIDFFEQRGARRFQFGMQVGANFEINRFYIGAGWNKDFMPILLNNDGKYRNDLRTSGMRVNIGWTF